MQGLNPITMNCTYKTPCGWYTKWDKKCDRFPETEAQKIINYIKSGKLPPLNTNNTHGVENTK